MIVHPKLHSCILPLVMCIAMAGTSHSRLAEAQEGESSEGSVTDSSEEEAAPSAPVFLPQAGFKPALVISVRDGSQLKALWHGNEWLKEFSSSDLSTGVFRRLAPLLTSLPDPGETTWKGRLVDALVGELLEKREVRLSWFARPGRVSPMGLSFQAGGPLESALIQGLVATYGGKPESVKLQLSSPERMSVPAIAREFNLTPVVFRGQSFAVGVDAIRGCITVSRDKEIAAWHLLECSEAGVAYASTVAGVPDDIKTRAKDGWIRLDLDEWVPHAAIPLRRLFKSSQALLLGLEWAPSGSRFKIAAIDLPHLDGKHESLLRGGNGVPEAMLKAIPSDAQFFAAAGLAFPPALGAEALAATLKQWSLQGAPKTGPAGWVTLVSIGNTRESAKGQDWSLVENSGLLISGWEGALLKGPALAKLFRGGDSKSPEVFVKPVCGSVMLVTPGRELIKMVEATCAGKNPSVAQWSRTWVDAVKAPGKSVALYWNPGAQASGWLELGWQIDQNGAAFPEELKASHALLSQLQPMGWVGDSNTNRTMLQGVAP